MSVAKRKAISTGKRMRIFERDGFKCVYCGLTPDMEDVVLHVDHILPVKEGGSNDPSNLRTACDKCNLGKGARILDTEGSPLDYGEIADRNAERAAQIDRYRLFMQKLQESEASLVDLLGNALFEPGRSFSPDHSDRNQAAGFIEKLGVERAIKAAKIANRKFPFYEDEEHWDYSKRWKYFCGVCWRMIKEPEQSVDSGSSNESAQEGSDIGIEDWSVDLHFAQVEKFNCDEALTEARQGGKTPEELALLTVALDRARMEMMRASAAIIWRAVETKMVDEDLGVEAAEGLQDYQADWEFWPNEFVSDQVKLRATCELLIKRHGNEFGMWDNNTNAQMMIDMLGLARMVVSLSDRHYVPFALLDHNVADMMYNVLDDVVAVIKNRLSNDEPADVGR